MATQTIPGLSLIQSPQLVMKKPDEVKLGLEKLQLIANLAKAAIDHFIKGQLSAFDALVGENACETRAGYIVDLTQNDAFYKILNERFKELEKICALFQQKDFIDSAKKDASNLRTSLTSICTKLGVNFELSEEEAFLVQSFLLAQIKEDVKGQDRSNPSLLQKYGTVSSKMCQNLVKEAQKDLSQKSVAYIQKLSPKMPFAEFTSAAFVQTDANGRAAAPCYFSLKMIVQHIWETKQSILYKIHPVKSPDSPPLLLLFKPGKESGTFEPTPLYKNLETAAHVWEGSSDLTEKEVKAAFKTLTLGGIFAMNNAQHPFYFGQALGKKLDWQTSSSCHKKALTEVALSNAFAKKIGCHKENKRVFYHDHSFADTVLNQIQFNSK